MSVAVHQFVPAVFPGDGVGNHALGTDEALRRAGIGAGVWAERFDRRLRPVVRRYDESERPAWSAGRSVLLYQASTGSEGMVDSLLREPAPLAIYYHNITPPRFFRPYDGFAAASMQRGRSELGRLARRARLAFAASEFSAADLRELGMEDVRLLPPYHAPMPEPDPGALRRLRHDERAVHVLFVGRLSPHKGQLDMVRVAALLDAGLGRPVRVFLVGGHGPPAYLQALRALIDHLGVGDVVRITGPLSQARLAAHYATADAFVCLSEHEGFCIPVLEAMRMGVPVVARQAAAVGETLAGTGVLVDGADPVLVAETVARVVCDAALREQIVRRQRERAAELDAFDRDAALVGGIGEVAG